MADEKFWKVDEAKTEDHWLELNQSGDVFGPYHAVAKWDGCVDIRRIYPDKNMDDDYMHICELDKFIEMLTELRDKAVEHFVATQGEWPG